jgi:hypothetical protein
LSCLPSPSPPCSRPSSSCTRFRTTRPPNHSNDFVWSWRTPSLVHPYRIAFAQHPIRE